MRVAVVMVVVLTAVVSVAIFSAFSFYSRKELEQTSMSILRQDLQQIETMLDTLDGLMLDFVSKSGYMGQFMNHRDTTALEEYKLIRQLDRFYDMILKLYPQGVSLYVYAPKTHRIYLNGRPYTSDTFMDMEWLKAALEHEKRNQWMGEKRMPIYDGHGVYREAGVVSCMRGYAIGEEGIVALFVDTSLLREALWSSLPNDESQIYIFASDGQLVADAGITSAEHLPAVRQSLGEEHGRLGIPQVYSVESDYTGWKYALRIPRSVGHTVFSTLGIVLTVSVLAFCLLLSTVWTVFFISPYRGISRIVEYLQSAIPIPKGDHLQMNELIYMRMAISELILQGKRMKQEIDIYKPVMHKQLIMALLRPGGVTSFPMHRDAMRSAGLPIYSKSFAVILIKNKDRAAYTMERLSPFLRGLMDEEIAIIGMDREDDAVVLLLSGSVPLAQRRPADFAREILAALAINDDPVPAVGIGALCADYMGIPVSYRTAQLALSHCLLLEGRGVMDYQEIMERSPEDTGLVAVAGELNAAVGALRSLDAQAMNASIAQLFRKMAALRFGPAMVKMTCSQLVFQGMEEAARFDANLTPMLYEYPQGILQQHEQQVSIAEHEAFILRLYGGLHSALQQRRNHVGSAKLAQRIVAYLDERYTDADLCVDKLADHFKVSAPHISRVFKESTGTSFSAYLTKLRIERAKTLLSESPDLLVAEVAAQVGYAQVQTFIRVFKKDTGVSPGSYKQEYVLGIRRESFT